MLGFGFIHSGRDILISHWISCSPLRRQQDGALLFSALLQRAVTALNAAGEMWVWRTSPSLRGHFWNPLMYWGRPASPNCLFESEKPHRGDPSVQIPWIQGALVEFCLFSFPFPIDVLASQAVHGLQWHSHNLLMVLGSVSIKHTSKKWMWNSFPAHLIEMGKEAATEELKTLLLQHVLYIWAH